MSLGPVGSGGLDQADMQMLMDQVQDKNQQAAQREQQAKEAAQKAQQAAKAGSSGGSGGSGGDQQSGGACPAKAPVDAQTQAASRQVASGAEATAKDKSVGSGAQPVDQTKAASRGMVDKTAADKAATDKAAADKTAEEEAKKAAKPATFAERFDAMKDKPGAVDAAKAKPTAEAKPTAPAAPDKNLKRGDKGDDVTALQKNLNTQGAKPPLAEDGKFGPKTQAAVKAYQRQQGITPDGKYGPRTREALKTKATDATKPTKPTDPAKPTGPVAPLKPGEGSAIERNKKAAQALLSNPNVHYWGGLSTGSDRKAIEQIAKTGQATVPHTGKTVTPKPEMMEALAKMAEKGPITINALTGGTHSTNSNHYRGTAVDLGLGLSSAQMAIARQFGGRKNGETSHAHIDF